MPPSLHSVSENVFPDVAMLANVKLNELTMKMTIKLKKLTTATSTITTTNSILTYFEEFKKYQRNVASRLHYCYNFISNSIHRSTDSTQGRKTNSDS